jgi:rubrerythrin
MSAGKGDSPRPVNGDRYRRNYEAIFLKEDSLSDILTKVREQFPYPTWICRPCGVAHGRSTDGRLVATYHQGTCDICGESASVTEPRDFGHLKKWPILPKNP